MGWNTYDNLSILLRANEIQYCLSTTFFEMRELVGAEMEPQKRPKSANLYRHAAISIDSWVRGNIDVTLRPLFTGILCFSIKG